VPKFSRPISRVNVEIKTEVSEISSVSIIRVDVMNDLATLIYVPVCQIDASAFNGTAVAPGAKVCMPIMLIYRIYSPSHMQTCVKILKFTFLFLF
jgi:hypothetical protein